VTNLEPTDTPGTGFSVDEIEAHLKAEVEALEAASEHKTTKIAEMREALKGDRAALAKTQRLYAATQPRPARKTSK
jgi:hypothetical protein